MPWHNAEASISGIGKFYACGSTYGFIRTNLARTSSTCDLDRDFCTTRRRQTLEQDSLRSPVSYIAYKPCLSQKSYRWVGVKALMPRKLKLLKNYIYDPDDKKKCLFSWRLTDTVYDTDI